MECAACGTERPWALKYIRAALTDNIMPFSHVACCNRLPPTTCATTPACRHRDLLEAAVMWRKSTSAQSSPAQPPRMPSPAQQQPLPQQPPQQQYPQQQQQQSRGERAPTPGGGRLALSPEGSLAVALGSVELSPSQQRARDQRVREWVEGAGV